MYRFNISTRLFPEPLHSYSYIDFIINETCSVSREIFYNQQGFLLDRDISEIS